MPSDDRSSLALTEVRVNFASLVVSVLKTFGPLSEELEQLWEWGEEFLDVNRDELEEELGINA